MVLYTFLINAVLVAIASILISPIYLAKFTNGETLGIAAFLAAIIGGFNQVRGAILGGFILGILDNLSAAYISSQYRGAFPLHHPHRGDSVATAGAARPRRGAHGMNRLGALAVAVAAVFAVVVPFILKPFGIYLISTVGGADHRRDRPQSYARLCRADFAGAGRLRRYRRLYRRAADASRLPLSDRFRRRWLAVL